MIYVCKMLFICSPVGFILGWMDGGWMARQVLCGFCLRLATNNDTVFIRVGQ